MKICFAAPENAWGGAFGLLRAALPEHEFVALGNYVLESLRGYDVVIPTMSRVTEPLLATADRLRLIQQVGSGLEGVDIEAARMRGIRVANVPTDSCPNADSVAELGIYMMIGLARNFRGMAASFANRRIGEPRGTTLMGKTVGIVGLGGIGKALAGKGHAAAQFVQIIGQNDIVPALEQHADDGFRLCTAVVVFLAGAHVAGDAAGEVDNLLGIARVRRWQVDRTPALGHVFVPHGYFVEAQAAQKA